MTQTLDKGVGIIRLRRVEFPEGKRVFVKISTTWGDKFASFIMPSRFVPRISFLATISVPPEIAAGLKTAMKGMTQSQIDTLRAIGVSETTIADLNKTMIETGLTLEEISPGLAAQAVGETPRRGQKARP